MACPAIKSRTRAAWVSHGRPKRDIATITSDTLLLAPRGPSHPLTVIYFPDAQNVRLLTDGISERAGIERRRLSPFRYPVRSEGEDAPEISGIIFRRDAYRPTLFLAVRRNHVIIEVTRSLRAA